MDFDRLLRFAVEHDASDVHIQTGLPPHLRLGGHLKATDQPPVDDKDLRAFITAIAPPRFRDNLDDRLPAGVDFSYALPGGTRFRCSAYSHMSQAGISMRTIKNRIPTVAELNLPPVVNEIALVHRGLVLVTGTTGSGKSTTLAAMIGLINHTRSCKIITIEDPVEYIHTAKQGVIAQLQVGTDTTSFEQALRQALRQDPDVILVGELRDMDTLRVALRAADTGHLVFSTVHSSSAPQTVERIIAMFPQGEQKLLLTQLAGKLSAIISQRLLICRDGSRRPTTEILRGGPVPQKAILEGRSLELHEFMRTGADGQHTFDQDLVNLHHQEVITVAEALKNATNPGALTMALRGISSGRRPEDPNHKDHKDQKEHKDPTPPKPPPQYPGSAGNGNSAAVHH
jgi:twitching motility protein PilT